MKLTKNIILILLFFYFANSAFAYDVLRVQDPKSTWRYGQGTIEKAVLSAKPSGLYMEYGLYLTFSARGRGFTNSDTLEVQFWFDLPENSIVCDSWLWVEGDIIKGEIMDKWTASSIYEDIVNRQKDPSILFKRSATSYELRIYPMAGASQRKVKITYLVPMQWNSQFVSAPLPCNLLRTSAYPVKLSLISRLGETWKNPEIMEYPEIQFETKYDSAFGTFQEASIASSILQNNLNLSLNSLLTNGIFLSQLKGEGNNIYQMALLPSEVLNINDSKKTAILIDYNSANTSLTKSDIWNGLKNLLMSGFTSADSFNLIFSHVSVKRASENWIAGDSMSIENLFEEFDENIISNYSNLPALLANGIDFVKSHGNDAGLMLISSSDQEGDFEVSNQLIDHFINLMEPKLPIYIADIQNQNFRFYLFGGKYYYGNEYFYTNLSKLTGGHYSDIYSYNYSFSEFMLGMLQNLGGFISSFDMHTKLEGGFCYGRFNLNSLQSSVSLNSPILQTGKFEGDFPFIIELSGIYESLPFSKKIIISEEETFAADSMSSEIWAGNYVNHLENQTQSNSVVAEIVDYSLSERVLSLYSAFLCLEPNLGGVVCYDCMDESQLTAISDSALLLQDTLIISVFPNPFNNQTNIQLTLPSTFSPDNSSIKIFNILGQAIRNFELNLSPGQKTMNISWNGTNDSGSSVSSGNYFLIVTTPQKIYSKKLLLMK
jgi:hypothetical protein